MEKLVSSTLLDLSQRVEATTIPADGKHTVAWCLGKLPALYIHYQATHESRYGDEITRLVQALVKELARGETEFPEAFAIAGTVASRFQVLHERLSLPILTLKSPAAPVAPRSRKKTATAGGD